jgi:DNA-binding NtrC family response regulator
MAQVPVLVVLADDGGVRSRVRQDAERLGFRTVEAPTSADVVRLVREERAQVLVMQAFRTWTETHDRVRSVAAAQPRCRIILVGATASVVSWADAAAAGIHGLLRDPVEADAVAALVAEIRDEHARRSGLCAAEAALADASSWCGLVGRGPAMQGLFERARRLAPHLAAALVVGEPGTGKQSFARALHALGRRQARPFVVVDCDCADPVVLEVRLFGGGWPAAPGDHSGLLAHANGGTVYIDDVVRLSARAQERLLGVLDRRDPDRWGPEHQLDLVVLAGAARHPRLEAQVGRFRTDLLARLSAAEFLLPPLRDRREDILTLAAAFLRDAAARAGKTVEGFAIEAEAALLAARWPGNVGQLREAVDRAVLLADGALVLERDTLVALSAAGPLGVAEGDQDDGQPLSSVEREHILRALQRTRGNKKAAARMLGVSRRALYRKLERLDLSSTIARRPRGRTNGPRPSSAAASPDGLPMRALSAKA